MRGRSHRSLTLLLYEEAEAPGAPVDDVKEVSTYVAALNHGLEKWGGGFPFSLRLMREMHGTLLATGRGSTKQPGDFRGHRTGPAAPGRWEVWFEFFLSHEILLMTDGRDLSLHQRIGEAADPLHFGYFGGLVTKLIWFVFGVALTTLSITGSAIYALRIMRSRKERKTLGRGTVLALRAPGWWAWPTGGLVVLGCGLMAASLIGAG
ncbi:PepSY domain-containing protein [Henriciella sp.]|uniref:PepSY domain-containing protein n=1 Tax=Henriciella sp. TaxID=1968823 RepID=UPI002617A9FE|nr:PepSY domain-containing protein [Henriciella sp.]